MIHFKLTFAQLGPTLRKLGPLAEKSLRRGMRSAAMVLLRQIDAEIRTSKQPPVDRGEYRAAWRMRPTANGAQVLNDSPQAVWVEFGRRPGPVSREGYERIKSWVQRKGLHLSRMGELTKSIRRRRAKGMNALARDIRKGSDDRAEANAEVKGLRREHNAKIKQDAQRRAVEEIAYAIKLKVEREGFAPRHILASAIANGYAGMEAALTEALTEGLSELRP